MRVALLGLGVEGRSSRKFFEGHLFDAQGNFYPKDDVSLKVGGKMPDSGQNSQEPTEKIPDSARDARKTAENAPSADLTPAEVEIFDPITPAEATKRDWSGFDLVLRSPSFPPIGQGLAGKNYEIPEKLADFDFSSQTRYFFEHCPAPIIGVTGTKGKGTTCALIQRILGKVVKLPDFGEKYAVLGKNGGKSAKNSKNMQKMSENAGKNAEIAEKSGKNDQNVGKITENAEKPLTNPPQVFLLGNIGAPVLDALDGISARDLVVLEMSSFQLWDLRKSPRVAVVLGIEPDHLNVHQSYAEYVGAKGNIVRWQGEADVCVFNKNNAEATAIAGESPARKLPYPVSGTAELHAVLRHLRLLGEHNRENAEAALSAVAGLLGMTVYEFVADPELAECAGRGLDGFKGLPHRLELVRSVAGVEIYDSSYSTDATAMQAALRSFPEREVILILGGRDKTADADFAEIKRIVDEQRPKKVILIGESGHGLVAEYPELGELAEAESNAGSGAEGEGGARVGEETLKAALAKALAAADAGDVILLSPAAASFDMFKDAGERGEIFQKIVRDWRQGS